LGAQRAAARAIGVVIAILEQAELEPEQAGLTARAVRALRRAAARLGIDLRKRPTCPDDRRHEQQTHGDAVND
jgi:hypothetical protein